MANVNPSYPTLMLDKLKIGENEYTLKDATLAALVAGFNNDVVTAALLSAVSGETADASKLVTNKAVKDYVDARVDAINKFDVRVGAKSILDTDPTADNMYILYLIADDDAEADSYIEYIAVRYDNAGSYTYKWEKIGSTKTDLSGYIQKTNTVAGVAFGDDGNITKEELEAAGALNLKDFAHADEGEGSYTPAGTIAVALKDATDKTEADVSRGDYTPAGTIAAEEVGGTKTANYTPAGSVTVTPATATFNAGSVTKVKANAGTDVAVGGFTAEVSGTTLVLTAASTAKVLTAADIEEGTAPSVKNGETAVTTIATGISDAKFDGTATHLGFTGTKEKNLKVSKVEYNKQVVDTDVTKTKFTGTQATITVAPKSGD